MKKILLFALIFTACTSSAADYVEELNALGLNEFSTDEEAEKFANKTCLQVELGEISYGSKVEGLAIKNFCNEYYDEFRMISRNPNFGVFNNLIFGLLIIVLFKKFFSYLSIIYTENDKK